VFGRLEDIKDYEESERIAAKVAASMAAAIKKGSPDTYSPPNDPGKPEREMKFHSGTIFDDLLPGESIETIDTNRPNTSLEAHRKGQLRAVSSGTQADYPSVSRDYGGSYSSQRQDLVESWMDYAVLSDELVGQFVAPVWRSLVSVMEASGLLDVPRDIDPATLDDALYLPPQPPWIDPWRESRSFETLERAGHASGPEIVRRRGRSPPVQGQPQFEQAAVVGTTLSQTAAEVPAQAEWTQAGRAEGPSGSHACPGGGARPRGCRAAAPLRPHRCGARRVGRHRALRDHPLLPLDLAQTVRRHLQVLGPDLSGQSAHAMAGT
jgi:hypothetical protein